MYILPHIPSRLRPGATRRRLEACIEILDAQVAGLRTGLVRTFECVGEPAPADLLTSPEDITGRLAAIEARQHAQEQAWTVWRAATARHDSVLDRHDMKFAAVFSTMEETAKAAGLLAPAVDTRQRLAASGLRVIDGGAR